MKQITRRQFVVKSSRVATGLIGAHAMGFNVISPGSVFADDVKFIESSCESPGKKILVVYESYCGSTSKVAQGIADVFCKKGAKVDLRHIKTVTDVSSYDGVVIGSAVKSASWYPSAINFVKENQAQLKQIPVIYFLTCLALYHDTEASNKIAKSYFNGVLNGVPAVKPRAIQAFAGVLDYSKLNMMFKIVMKSKMKKKGIPEGDFRDFGKIGSWALNTAWPRLQTS
jgi:menaquinone-dependent protoporphyrinogen oxidase